MKKIAVTCFLAVILCTGCSNDSAKIAALDQKVDLLIQNQSIATSNEAVLLNEIGVVRNQVTNLPDLAQIDGMTFYYHTNEMDVMHKGFAGIDLAISGLADVDESLLGAVSLIETNELNMLEAPTDNNSLSKQIDDIEVRAAMIEWDLTKPLIASNITVGALFRSVHTCSPTLFINEADTFMAGNGTMRGIINSGNTRRTAYVLRLSQAKLHHSKEPSPHPDPLPSHPMGAERGQPANACRFDKSNGWRPTNFVVGNGLGVVAARGRLNRQARRLPYMHGNPLSPYDVPSESIEKTCPCPALP